MIAHNHDSCHDPNLEKRLSNVEFYIKGLRQSLTMQIQNFASVTTDVKENTKMREELKAKTEYVVSKASQLPAIEQRVHLLEKIAQR